MKLVPKWFKLPTSGPQSWFSCMSPNLVKNWNNKKIDTAVKSVAARIRSPLESDLSLCFLEIQKGPTDLLKGFPGNTKIDPILHTSRF